jgi:RND family efflux transporter MFP subunit
MKWVQLLCVTVLAAACAKAEGEAQGAALPPPTGEGVKPPEVPAVKDLLQADTAAVTKSNEFAATGTLYPREQAELGPKVTGVLRSVEVDEGDRVKKGQVVFRLDSSQSGLMLQQAEAQVNSAKTNLRATELEYQRARELNARGSLPAATFEQIQARHESAQNAVAQAEVAVAMARRGIADTVVTSPIDGVVTARHKEPGETATMMPVTVVVVVQDVSVLELRTRLAESALGKLDTNSELRVVLPSVGVERTVKVKRINPAVDMATRTVEVIAELDNADGSLKPGMLANVTLIGAETAPASGKAGGPASSASEGAGSAGPTGTTASQSGATP